MKAIDALNAAVSANIIIILESDKLRLKGKEKPSEIFLNDLATCKSEIIDLLSTNSNAWSYSDWHVHFNERAAIAQYDGGLGRKEAELRAYNCCVSEWLNQKQANSTSSDNCAHCSAAESNDALLLPFGTEDIGFTWLHSQCWPDWYEDQKAIAVVILGVMGIRKPED